MINDLANVYAQNVAWVVFCLLLIPYLVWGVYSLRHTMVRGFAFRARTEAITMVLLAVFFVVEFHLLTLWLGNRQLQLLFAAFCLFASGLALYGPMAVSLATHLLVDQVMPARKDMVDEPQYSAGEACERLGNFEGAANEYVLVSRMFPKDATAALRAADNLMRLSKTEEAVEWFEKGLKNCSSPEQSLSVTNRLFEIYRGTLHRSDKARKVLETYLGRFPTAEYTHSVKARLARLDDKDTGSDL